MGASGDTFHPDHRDSLVLILLEKKQGVVLIVSSRSSGFFGADLARDAGQAQCTAFHPDHRDSLVLMVALKQIVSSASFIPIIGILWC